MTARLTAAAWPISVAGRLARELVEDQRELEPDQHEQQRVEQEHERVPDREALKPHPRRGDLRRAPAEHDPDGDRGEHARRADRLGGQVARVAAQQRDRDLDRDVVEPPADLGDDPADGQADQHAGDRAEHELEPGLQQREAAADGGRDRDAVGDERRAVVDEALALDDRDDAARHAPAGARRSSPRRGRWARRSRRARTRRAHGRPSTSACATSATVHIVASTSPTASSEIERTSRLRSCRLAKNAAEYSSGGRKITSTRSGSSSTSGRPGTKPSTSAAHDEDDRVGNVDRTRGGGQAGHRDEQADQYELDVMHG